MRGILISLIVLGAGCSSTVHFQKPTIVPSPSGDLPDNSLSLLEGPEGIYKLEPIPADIDPALTGRTEHVAQDVYSMDVCVGEAILWALRQDPGARVKVTFSDARFDKELHFGGLLAANSEITYSLYILVSIDGGAPRPIVAVGRSAMPSAPDAVRHSVAICIRDLHAQMSNMLRSADLGSGHASSSGH